LSSNPSATKNIVLPNKERKKEKEKEPKINSPNSWLFGERKIIFIFK
jgi:hypothetical protein